MFCFDESCKFKFESDWNLTYDFIEKIEFCRKRPDLLRGIGERARQFAVDNFDSLAVAKRVFAAYETFHAEKVEKMEANGLDLADRGAQRYPHGGRGGPCFEIWLVHGAGRYDLLGFRHAGAK